MNRSEQGALTAYWNGEFVPFEQVRISPLDLGFLQAATITERLRTFNGKPFLMGPHISRLQHSLKAVGIDPGLTPDQWQDAILQVGERNRSRHPSGDQAIVIFVTAGEHGGSPNVCVHSLPLRFGDWADAYQQGRRLIIPATRQVPSESIPVSVKHRSRLHWFLAERQAKQVDPQAEALLLDQKGDVTETSSSNLFIVNDGTILTPHSRNSLRGVSQHHVFSLCERLDLPSAQMDLSPGHLYDAEEVWLSCTSYCLLPVTKVDGHTIGDGQPGPQFARFIEAWSDTVGVDIIAQARQFAG